MFPIDQRNSSLCSNSQQGKWFFSALYAMFVYCNLFFEKLFFKFFCVCLPLKKLINRKHFPVNEEHFPVNKKHFPVKEKFSLVSRKVFSLWLCSFSGN
jgi:hypothetical protein